jgi:hypothetical protein
VYGRSWLWSRDSKQRLVLGLVAGDCRAGFARTSGGLRQHGQAAAAAIQSYVEYIQTVILPEAAGDFAAGRELFDELLHEQHLVDYNADELFADRMAVVSRDPRADGRCCPRN